MHNRKKKILVVFGTRPEAIKLCPLIWELRKHDNLLKTTVCVTAQHRQMLDQFLEVFDIAPDHDLDLMRNEQTLFDITSRVLVETGRIMALESPDLVIVQGDTTTTLSTSLSAYYHHIPVAHVEAGLRTHDIYAPFPEEVNRRITSVVSALHFSPTEKARQNLLFEGILGSKIYVTGNTVIDALLWVKNKIDQKNINFDELKEIDFSKRIILITGHRRENFGADFIDICTAIKSIATDFSDTEVVYPVHLNPNVKKPVYQILDGIPNVKLIAPLSYKPFVKLMDSAYLIITDSGGVQEEAPSLGKPVLVTRSVTERPEAVDAGAVKLVGSDATTIIDEVHRLIKEPAYYKQIAKVKNPYGDGKACKRIVDILFKWFDD